MNNRSVLVDTGEGNGSLFYGQVIWWKTIGKRHVYKTMVLSNRKAGVRAINLWSSIN
jgi:hypothetical protein